MLDFLQIAIIALKLLYSQPVSINADLPKYECQTRLMLIIWREYGAAMRAAGVQLPGSPFFLSEDASQAFQNSLNLVEIYSGHEGHWVKLQRPVADAFLAARQSLLDQHQIPLTLGRHKSGLRSFNDTLEIWNRNQPDVICRQSTCFLAACSLEADNFLDRIRSTALPGTSQHHLGTAIDIEEWHNTTVRDVLEEYGFYRTVFADRPHFTYLGVNDPTLLGLSNVEDFWVIRR